MFLCVVVPVVAPVCAPVCAREDDVVATDEDAKDVVEDAVVVNDGDVERE